MFTLESVSRSIHLDNVEDVTDDLVGYIRATAKRFKRVGVVVAMSGGIDSSVCVGLAAKALGPARVRGVTLPDKESSEESATLAEKVAAAFGVTIERHDITPALEALGCYTDRLAVVRKYDAAFDPARGDTFSVEFDPAIGGGARLQSFALNVVRDGTPSRHRIGGQDFLAIMAATNLKQRVRMLSTYRIADEHNLLVIGTSNRPELSQGFYVKHGDGCGEAFPLRQLLKTQVYEIAAHIGVPEAVRQRPPTTDTFSADQSQEAYFYGTSVTLGDELWLAWSEGEDPAGVASRLAMPVIDVEKFFGLYSRRAAYAEYLHETV